MATHSVIICKTVLPIFSVVPDGILFILTGNDDIHKSLDEFEIRPDNGKVLYLGGAWEDYVTRICNFENFT